jgi:purine-cytosine permease-like protein
MRLEAAAEIASKVFWVVMLVVAIPTLVMYFGDKLIELITEAPLLVAVLFFLYCHLASGEPAGTKK